MVIDLAPGGSNNGKLRFPETRVPNYTQSIYYTNKKVNEALSLKSVMLRWYRTLPSSKGQEKAHNT